MIVVIALLVVAFYTFIVVVAPLFLAPFFAPILLRFYALLSTILGQIANPAKNQYQCEYAPPQAVS